MQAAVPIGIGAMAALIGLDFETVSKVAKEAAEYEVCEAANDNDPAQVVVSGHKGAVDRAIKLAKEYGAKRAVLLPVSAPFHCSLMAHAGEVMEKALLETKFLEQQAQMTLKERIPGAEASAPAGLVVGEGLPKHAGPP